ncbi:MAG: isoleucine--tRNA ligase [Rhodospirillaceae bacterium]|nr:isoleucine--tRNA ligase [Rhodospirillaceae bacterium]
MTDYKATVFLPRTDFPMKAELPKREPELLARWRDMDLFGRTRAASRGLEKFVLHDGPPYANGNLHIGHALNKILKDVVSRTQQMLGKDSNYVPGWDCHGLPIEWKVEEDYRAKGKDKDKVDIIDFRRECRDFAAHWMKVQSGEFQRLGVIGDWQHPYATMEHKSESVIARELMKFAANGLLYRGSKPVMWSVVEKTALAEAEVEYEDYVSDQVWVAFPIKAGAGGMADLLAARVLIWTTTPWTIPGNRAISYSPKIEYGLYKTVAAPEGNWAPAGGFYLIATKLAAEVFKAAKVETYELVRLVPATQIAALECSHPLHARFLHYDFVVPLLAGDHVSADAGSGFVHTAPGHGRDDFEIWTANVRNLADRGINPHIPYTVDADGFFTDQAPGFAGKRVITEKGDKGDANEAVIAALKETHAIIARARLTHQYPHSWRSKKPVIFRNTPQWFIALDRDVAKKGDTLRARALAAIEDTRWVPGIGKNRINGMIENRPDWVISRQRAWGVPIPVFVREAADGTAEILKDERVNTRIAEAFAAEGADSWYREGAAARFLRPEHDPASWRKVDDIVDVWFESGCTHAFVLEQRPDLAWPASLYLEGSDQHRGWFHSSLLESCGTRGRAPYRAVLTHGFVLDEQGRKMSKSLGNVVAPQQVVDKYGADILRLWVVASDYSDDLRIGPEILKHQSEIYRRLRNTLRYILGSVAGFTPEERVAPAEMPEFERWVLHRLVELDVQLRRACADFEFHQFYAALHAFCAVDLSAFYFDVRKDALYCDRPDSPRRRAARTMLDILFDHLTAWLAPVLCFTAEEAWLARGRSGAEDSVHLRRFPDVPPGWRNEALAETWARIRALRRVVTGALEIARAGKVIGSGLEAAPIVYAEAAYRAALAGVDPAEVAITSGIEIRPMEGATVPSDVYVLPDIPGVAVIFAKAQGQKCERCWKVLPEVGRLADHPDLCGRCADAVTPQAAAR